MLMQSNNCVFEYLNILNANKYNADELQKLTIDQISNMTGVNKINLSMYFDL